jgi:hypothetical protein
MGITNWLLQEFAATIVQMAHRAFVGLPLHFIKGRRPVHLIG